MTGWAIMAIPSEHDQVWKYSSEKVPHMTLLYLGDQTENLDVKQMIEFISHVAKTTMHPFYMEVDRRGLLGSDNADVLFFKKSKRDTSMIENARAFLLTDPEILKAYSSADQYPEWTPHLTMGYPETPAKKDEREYPGIHHVEFDRIALWTGDYSGVEFKLEYNDEDMGLAEVAMSDQVESFLQHLGIVTDGETTMDETLEDTDEFLAHYGVKGMKWGSRKAPNTNQEEIHEHKSRKKASPLDVKSRMYDRANADTAVTVTLRPGQKVTTKGGSNYPASEDAIKAAVAKRVARSSSTDALSNKELQTLVNRMNLEQQYSKLSNPNNAQVKNGQSVVKKLLGIKSDVDKLANDPFVKKAASDIASEFIKRKSQGAASPGTDVALR